jgi:hypothetical protein
MPDWDADARSLLAKFRLSLGQAAEPGEFLGLISGLNAISADFRQERANINQITLRSFDITSP